MRFTVKDLLDLIQKSNIPMDAEVWMEYPACYGVIPSHPDNPTFEHIAPTAEHFHEQESDWIVATTIGWSPAENKLRIFHHF